VVPDAIGAEREQTHLPESNAQTSRLSSYPAQRATQSLEPATGRKLIVDWTTQL